MRTIAKATLLATALLLVAGAPASAQRLRGRIIVGPHVGVYAPFYDPFFLGYYPYAGYPYVPYVAGRAYGDVRTGVTPKDAQVYVDGFYAGTSSDFDGVFKRLHLPPGGHAITLYLPGFRTLTRNVYVRPDATVKLNDMMEPLASGESSTPPPPPARSPGRASARQGQG